MKSIPVKNSSIKIYLFLVAFSLVGSLISHYNHTNPTGIAHPTALLTLAIGCLAAFQPTWRVQGAKTLWALGVVWFIGALAELVGLSTGFPFGRYRYTDQWWPVVHLPGVGAFPLQLPFAWVLVLGSSYLLVAPRLQGWAIVVAAALAMLVDQVMEPTMTRSLGYWKWIDTGPLAGRSPIWNAVGWFLVSMVAAYSLRLMLGKNLTQTYTPGIVLLAHVGLVLGLGWISVA